ncbi:BA14K family protein [Rhizobium binxianense]
MKKIAIVMLSLVTAFADIAPAGAFPILQNPAPAPKAESSDVQQVQHRIIRRGRNPYVARMLRDSNGPRRYYRGDYYRRGNYRGDYYRRGRYYDDYRYGRYYRRRHNDAGAIIGGLAAGAIIGGILSSQQPRYYRGGSSHARWCYARYRSYRAYDNTYQPYGGPRRQCVSPY